MNTKGTVDQIEMAFREYFTNSIQVKPQPKALYLGSETYAELVNDHRCVVNMGAEKGGAHYRGVPIYIVKTPHHIGLA